MHWRVRREFWGFAKDENLSTEQLVAEEYRGIRPAPGYPACPDHTEKGPLFEMLKAPENAGIIITESYAMVPTAAVSGFYFSHPEADYFAVGQNRQGPGGRLRQAEGLDAGGNRKMAGPGSGIRTELMGRNSRLSCKARRSELIKAVSLSQPKVSTVSPYP